jgi:hypothetical protein
MKVSPFFNFSEKEQSLVSLTNWLFSEIFILESNIKGYF